MNTPEQIGRIVEDYLASEEIPGAAVAVVRQGAIAFEAGFGLADIAAEHRATEHTVWPIASLTKSFTSVAAMQLVERGQLQLDEPVQTYLPHFRVHDEAASRKMTMRAFLRHSSGMGRTGHQDRLREESDEAYPTRDALVRALDGVVLQSEPNTTWSYSNEGYATAGHTIETAAGMPLEEVFERIFERAGMTRSYVRFEDWRQASDRALPYGKGSAGPFDSGERHGEYAVMRYPRDYRAFLSTGGISSTAHDLARYQLATMDYQHSPLLSAGSLDHAHSVQWPYGDTGWGYGFGYQVMWSGSTRVIGHSGGLPGVSNYSLMAPAEGLGVVVLTNGSDKSGFVLAERIMDAVRGAPLFRASSADPLPFGTACVADPEALEAYEGTYDFRMGAAYVAPAKGGLTVVTPSRYDAHEVRIDAMQVGPDTFLGRGGAQPIYFVRDSQGRVVRFTHLGYAYPKQ